MSNNFSLIPAYKNFIEQGKAEEAATALETAVSINPKLPEAHVNLGIANEYFRSRGYVCSGVSTGTANVVRRLYSRAGYEYVFSMYGFVRDPEPRQYKQLLPRYDDVHIRMERQTKSSTVAHPVLLSVWRF